MSFRISRESHFEIDFGETSFENIFIQHYLPFANEIQLKVYLVAMYYAKNEKETSISSLAKVLEINESQVLDALQYWENQNLLAIENTDGEFGVAFYSLRTQIFTGTSSKSCVSNPAKELVEMINAIIGRTLTSAEYTFYEKFRNETDGNTEVLKTVLTLYYKDLKRNSFSELRSFLNYILKTRNTDLEFVTIQANHYFMRHKFYKKVKSLIGGKSDVTLPEQGMINNWLDKYHMSEEEIIQFIEQNSPNTNNPTIGFLNKAIVQDKEKTGYSEKYEDLFKKFKQAITGSRYAVNKAEKQIMSGWMEELGLNEDQIFAEIEKYSATRRGATVSFINDRIRGIGTEENSSSGKKTTKTRTFTPDFVDEELEALISQREANNANRHR